MITVHFYKNGTGASDKSGKSEMENYLALVAIILKAVCGLASLEGAFRCSKIKQAISTKKITLCSLIPGMGQFVNGQAFKGIVFSPYSSYSLVRCFWADFMHW